MSPVKVNKTSLRAKFQSQLLNNCGRVMSYMVFAIVASRVELSKANMLSAPTSVKDEFTIFISDIFAIIFCYLVPYGTRENHKGSRNLNPLYYNELKKWRGTTLKACLGCPTFQLNVIQF